jgi:glycogen debranching enzyme
LVRSPRREHFEVAGRAGPVELQRAPPIPAEAREELLVIKDGELFLCARPDGDVAPAQVSGEGLYAYDTRYLSEVRLEVGGARPVALSYAAVDDQAVVDSTNAQLSRGSAEPIPQLSLSVTRELMIVSGRLYYLVRLRNFLRECVTTTASLAVAADFADMFEVRGGVRRPARGHAMAPKRTGRGLVLAYVGEGEIFREAVIELAPAPDDLDLGTGQTRGRGEVTLEPAKPLEILMTVEPSIGGRRRRRRRRQTAAAELERSRADWFASCTQIRSDSELFDALIATTIRDLRALSRRPRVGGSCPRGSRGTSRRSVATRW